MNEELLEETFATWINNGVKAHTILVALHNACVHGTIFTENGYEFKEKTLNNLFDGFDKSLKALGKIEK
jgi:hypothetical protein